MALSRTKAKCASTASCTAAELDALSASWSNAASVAPLVAWATTADQSIMASDVTFRFTSPSTVTRLPQSRDGSHAISSCVARSAAAA